MNESVPLTNRSPGVPNILRIRIRNTGTNNVNYYHRMEENRMRILQQYVITDLQADTNTAA